MEWMAIADCEKMLGAISERGAPRKLRLFACACGRQLWQLLIDERSKIAVMTSESFADGQASISDLETARNDALEASELLEDRCVPGGPIDSEEIWSAAEVAWEIASTHPHPWHVAYAVKNPAKCAHLLGDVFGNPFRPVAFDPAWRSSTVASLAEAIYAERAFDRLPILADALEDAGCTSSDVLEHCRQPGEHVRGCWVVDLVLGKE